MHKLELVIGREDLAGAGRPLGWGGRGVVEGRPNAGSARGKMEYTLVL